MQPLSANRCNDLECEYNNGVIRPHYHVMTLNGSYVKFIIDRPKPIKEIYDADTR